MQTGISIYCGLDVNPEENLKLLETAADLGISRIFTSLHIPETNLANFKTEIKNILASAKEKNFDVCADISPETKELLGLSTLTPTALHALGITTVRLDAGFSTEEIAAFSQELTVQFNASTLTPEQVANLLQAGLEKKHLDALHNFYPRPHTGLSLEFFIKQTNFLQIHGFTVGAFVPSQFGKRGPLYAGLPTLEEQREESVATASAELVKYGLNSIFIGDSKPSLDEVKALTACGKNTFKDTTAASAPTQTIATTSKKSLPIKIKLLSRDKWTQEFLKQTFTSRYDEARDAIRAAESRTLLHGHVIKQEAYHDAKLLPGNITLDNETYGRYMGELQIIKNAQHKTTRTNLVARVLPDELEKLSLLGPNTKFHFEIIK
jgi:hypothetical protein